MNAKMKMKKEFQGIEGGLFSTVEKADISGDYQAMAEQGIDLMGWADPFTPDFSLPKHVEQASHDALKGPLAAHYTAPIGNETLKQLIASKIKKQNHIDIDWKRNLIITPGSDSGLYYAMLPFIERGDEVMVPVPCYPNNLQNISTMGGTPIYIPLKEENNFELEIDEFEKRVSDKTKMVILTHPNNPTTTVFSPASLKQLSEFIIKHDLILVCDQAFEDFIYDDKEMITPASLPGMWERTLTVFSVSKGMGFSGYRVGYIMACDQIMDVLFGAAVSVVGATHTLSQLAMIEAFKDPSFMNEFEEAFDARRKYAYEHINAIPNVSMLMPESGFLCWINVSKLGTGQEIYHYLLKHAKVAINDGAVYGEGGKDHIRVVLGVYRDSNKVYNAIDRIQKALMNHPNQKK
ncbi:MAG: pyridoxal phosphate-dependent aminotransferase [Erysipelotrichaceae bacterium]